MMTAHRPHDLSLFFLLHYLIFFLRRNKLNIVSNDFTLTRFVGHAKLLFPHCSVGRVDIMVVFIFYLLQN